VETRQNCRGNTPKSGGGQLVLTDGRAADYPVFLPVHHRDPMVTPEALARAPGMIANAYFFYKDRQIRTQVRQGLRLRDLVPHDGILMTDSGAFQGFNRPLYLKNRTIVAFQAELGADIVSPLDLVTGPWEKRSAAEQKLAATHQRVVEALRLVDDRLVAGVQQGGRFLDLRARATDDLLAAGARYLALGSLVPFLTRNHDVRLVVRIVRDARERAGPDMPLHLYGAGDPVELPLFALAGANVFDSSSFAHFAIDGWYMTPLGALPLERAREADWTCGCDVCVATSWDTTPELSARQLSAHNLTVVLDAIDAIRTASRAGRLAEHVTAIVTAHQVLFPDSELEASAQSL
jgi:7-cyano-7-deazaguanine tRNA-ribosyltransferase